MKRQRTLQSQSRWHRLRRLHDTQLSMPPGQRASAQMPPTLNQALRSPIVPAIHSQKQKDIVKFSPLLHMRVLEVHSRLIHHKKKVTTNKVKNERPKKNKTWMRVAIGTIVPPLKMHISEVGDRHNKQHPKHTRFLSLWTAGHTS